MLLLENALNEIAGQVAADLTMRRRVVHAARRLRDEQSSIKSAVRELIAIDAYPSVAAAQRAVARAAQRALRHLDA